MDRIVHVARERLERWLAGFSERHGAPEVSGHPEVVRLTATDGAVAEVHVPFGPIPVGHDPLGSLVAHACRDRRVGVVLARKGGHAAGLFVGARLLASKVGSGYVQGRTKAGGWSQQRYARRRDNQAAKEYAKAAEAAANVLLPRLEEVDHLVLGGDRPACTAVLADHRLAPLAPLAEDAPFYATPDPRLKVLEAFPEQFLAVRIGLNELA